MNRKEKLDLIFKDEEMRIAEQQTQAQKELTEFMKMREMLSSGLPNETIQDDFQHKEIELGKAFQEVFKLDIDNDRAAVITYIGNDWYPGVEYKFSLDGQEHGGTIEREIAPTNNPLEVQLLAKSNVKWEAKNDGDEARNLGVVTGGHFIPVEVYDTVVNTFKDFESDITNIPPEMPDNAPQLLR